MFCWLCCLYVHSEGVSDKKTIARYSYKNKQFLFLLFYGVSIQCSREANLPMDGPDLWGGPITPPGSDIAKEDLLIIIVSNDVQASPIDHLYGDTLQFARRIRSFSML
jgi:hypothetical protein